MKRILIRNAAILPLDEADTYIEHGYLAIEGEHITAVGAGDPPPAEPDTHVIEAAGMLAVPGLVNAHTHSQSATLPGFGDCLSHPAFMWLTQAHTARRTPDETRLAVLLTAWAALASGTTSLIDHFPGQRFVAADVEAVMKAWEETGMRAALGLRFFDAAFDDIYPAEGILPPELQDRLRQATLLQPQPFGELRELMDEAMRRWHRKTTRLSVFPAPSNPDRCTDEALLLCADLAQRYDSGIHTHLLETRKQAQLAVSRYGCTSVQRLHRLGVLSDRWSNAHCCWLDDGDIDLMAETGAIAVLNTESNARLGSGTAPIPTMLRAGMRMAIGTDGAGANDNLSMQEAMRAAATQHRPAQSMPQDWLSARQVLHMATAGGAEALRRPQLGRLAPGWLADLALYRMDTPAWLPVNDPVAQLVFAETGASVDTVLVAGEILLAQGKPTRFDTSALCEEIRAMAKRLRHRNADLFAAAEVIAGHMNRAS